MGSKLLYSLPALVLASLALVLAIVGLSQDSKPPPTISIQADSAAKKTDQYRYWVITQPLQEGDSLSADKLAVVSSSTVIPEAISADQKVEGRRLQRYARPGEVITKDFFELGGSLPSSLSDGHRAMAIPVDDVIGAGGLLQPGDRVDVVTAFRHSDDKKGAAAMVMLHNIPVLAVRGILSRNSGQKDDAKRRNNTVVLSVPEARIAALMLASSEGKIRLAVVAREENGARFASGQPVSTAGKAGDNTSIKGDAVASGANDAAGKADRNDGKPFYFNEFFPAEHKSPVRTAPSRPRGHRVQVFEGSATRSTYVQ